MFWLWKKFRKKRTKTTPGTASGDCDSGDIGFLVDPGSNAEPHHGHDHSADGGSHSGHDHSCSSHSCSSHSCGGHGCGGGH